MEQILALKVQLLSLCTLYVDQRIATAQAAIKGAQASANEETKSSSGDKYETGRAMAQLEIEKNSSQLAEAQKLKHIISQLRSEISSTSAQLGSIVKTNKENYFISIPAGKLLVGNEVYYAISTASPIAQKLIGLKLGAKFSFNKQEIEVVSVL